MAFCIAGPAGLLLHFGGQMLRSMWTGAMARLDLVWPQAAGQAIGVVDKYVCRLVSLADPHVVLERSRLVWQSSSAELHAECNLWVCYRVAGGGRGGGLRSALWCSMAMLAEPSGYKPVASGAQRLIAFLWGLRLGRQTWLCSTIFRRISHANVNFHPQK